MFDSETLNAFDGGFRFEIPSVVTLFGNPAISVSEKFISVPISRSIEVLAKRGDHVSWKGKKEYEQNYTSLPTNGSWSDPIREMTTISLQRGWTNPPEIMAIENVNFNAGIGYISAFIISLIMSFSSINDITLSSSEMMQISTEIQEKMTKTSNRLEVHTQIEGRPNSIMISEGPGKGFRNEIWSQEPYSLYLIEENALSENPNFKIFERNFRKFNTNSMLKKDPNSLNFPFNSYHSHFSHEGDYFEKLSNAIDKNDLTSFVEYVAKMNESVEFNLNVISPFQHNIAGLLRKYNANSFCFNISEFSGSVLLFADGPTVDRVRENVIRDYFGLTNKTISINEVNISGPIKKERIVH